MLWEIFVADMDLPNDLQINDSMFSLYFNFENLMQIIDCLKEESSNAFSGHRAGEIGHLTSQTCNKSFQDYLYILEYTNNWFQDHFFPIDT